MLEFIALNLAPIMFASLVIFLLIGYPVAFSLAANGLLFYIIGVLLTPYADGAINIGWNLLNAWPARTYGVMSNETLLAVPFFTFMGIVLERSGMAEDLLDTIGQLFGPVRGGLAYAVIVVGALLAATTGVVAASVIAMGLISLPIMLRYNYDRSIATGVITASGTLAQVIPPSLVLIVLADQLGRSVGDMYKGALLPGLILVGMYMAYVLVISILRPKAMPALPPEERRLGSGLLSLIISLALGFAIFWLARRHFGQTNPEDAPIIAAGLAVLILYGAALADKYFKLNVMSRLTQEVIIVLIPPLALIFLVLGTIFLGVATPTEGGAMGAVGALIIAAAKRRLNLQMLTSALDSTTKLSAFVMFILIGSRVFALTFYGLNGHQWVEHLLTSLPGGEWGFLIVVSLLIFVLGFFLDFFELAFILVPLLAPAAETLGIDLIWFGVILGLNMQTSFLTPPFGFALFYLRSVAARVPYLDRITGQKIDEVKTGEIYKGSIPFICIQVSMIAIVMLFPGLVMHYKGAPVDTSNVEFTVPDFGSSGSGGSSGGLGGFGGMSLDGAPSFGGAPAGGSTGSEAPAAGGMDLSQPPSFGTPAPAEDAPEAPAAPDLSSPPDFGTPAPAEDAAPSTPDLSTPPDFGGAEPAEDPAEPEAEAPNMDLSQPPSFN
ncbi:TRAP transporter large permease subunit [Paracoccaceae bacterium GXU_MW_L88]